MESSAMDLTEEEWESGPTVEDIISSVMKTESKFGKKKLSLPTLNRPSRKFTCNLQALEECRDSKNYPASTLTLENNELTKARTEEYKSFMQPFNGQLGNSNTGSLSDFLETSSSGYITQLVKTDIKTSSQAGFVSGSQSASKMTRSISTPDMRLKQQQVYMPSNKDHSQAPTEPPASRQKLFNEEIFSNMKKEEKENTSSQISSLENNSLVLSENKDEYQNLNESNLARPLSHQSPQQMYEVKQENEASNFLPDTKVYFKSENYCKDQSSCLPNSVRVVVEFEGGEQNELKLVAGELLTVVKHDEEEGWLQGYNQTGQYGRFPALFVEQPGRSKEVRKQSSPPCSTSAVSNSQLPPHHFNNDDKSSITNKNCAKSVHTPHTIMNSNVMKRNVEATSQHPMTASYSKSAAMGSQKTDAVAFSNTVHPARTVVADIQNVAVVAAPTQPITAKLETMDHISINDQNYLKLSILGKGGSSKVYEVLDLESKIVKAIKVVDLEGIDEATLNGYNNEIGILERLKWTDRVVRLYDYEQTPKTLKIVMERGNRDLSSILSNARGKKATPISPFTIQHYWHGMLLACQAIHTEGIVHSDLKPANFLLVNEMIKLIDFGIASSIQDDMTSVFKDSQSGTFNYMSPESLNDVHHGPIINGLAGNKPIIKIGVKSDVWSLGCILYNLVYGRTPFQHISNPLQKLAAISDHRTKISFPDIADKKLLDVIKQCLQFDSRSRPSIEELLRHPYLSSGALAQAKSPPKPDALSTSQREAMQNLVALSPNSLMKITSMMQKMKDSHKIGD